MTYLTRLTRKNPKQVLQYRLNGLAAVNIQRTIKFATRGVIIHLTWKSLCTNGQIFLKYKIFINNKNVLTIIFNTIIFY